MNNMMIDEMIVGLVFPTRSQVPLGNGEGSQANLRGEGRLQGRAHVVRREWIRVVVSHPFRVGNCYILQPGWVSQRFCIRKWYKANWRLGVNRGFIKGRGKGHVG